MSPLTYSVPPSEERSRLSVAFRGVLAIPHVVMWAFWSWLANTLAFIQWFVIVVTGQRNEGIFEAQQIALGYMTRALGYATLLFDRFPTLGLVGDPATGEFETPFERRADRLSNGLRLILMIPAVLLLLLVGVAQIVVAVTSWFVIVVSGRHPDGMWSMLVRCGEFNLRLQAYALLMTDDYPRYGDGVSRSTAPSFGGAVVSARGGTH